MAGSETDESGETAYLISTHTEMLRNLELTDRAATAINALLMGYASMAGPVYDERAGTLSLCSLVRVHESNGLLLLQSFRAGNFSEEDAIRFALSLNASELTECPTGYGFGSFCHNDGCIHFTTFLPNAAHRPGLLPSFYYAAASRALAMANRLENASATRSGCIREPKS